MASQLLVSLNATCIQPVGEAALSCFQQGSLNFSLRRLLASDFVRCSYFIFCNRCRLRCLRFQAQAIHRNNQRRMNAFHLHDRERAFLRAMITEHRDLAANRQFRADLFERPGGIRAHDVADCKGCSRALSNVLSHRSSPKSYPSKPLRKVTMHTVCQNFGRAKNFKKRLFSRRNRGGDGLGALRDGDGWEMICTHAVQGWNSHCVLRCVGHVIADNC